MISQKVIMMHDFTGGNRGGKVWGGIDKGVVEGEREGGGGTDKAVSADAVRGKVRGKEKSGGRKDSGREDMVLEQGGKIGEVGEGDREKARTRVDKVSFIELSLFIQTWLSRLPN